VSIVDVITSVQLSIIVGIEIVHDINGNTFNILTGPSTITGYNIKWAGTDNVIHVWAVFISPSIFTFLNASMDFTSIDL
jgi:hypothetical protein